MRRWLVLFIVLWFPFSFALAQTWSAWNGITVGSTAGNIGKWNGITIGTTAGNIGKWNNLTSPSGGGGGSTFVLDSLTTCHSSFATTVTCAATSAIPVGARAVVLFYTNVATSGFLTSVTDPSSNTWGTCIFNDGDAASGFAIAVCDAVITTQISAGANITGHLANNSNGMGEIIYVANSHTGASGVDTSGTASGSVSSATATTSANLSATDFVFFATVVRNTSTVGAISSGYTALQTGTTAQNSYIYKIYTAWKTQASGATATGSATVSPSDDAATTIAGYKQ